MCVSKQISSGIINDDGNVKLFILAKDKYYATPEARRSYEHCKQGFHMFFNAIKNEYVLYFILIVQTCYAAY
jgi:hypothetical protein